MAESLERYLLRLRRTGNQGTLIPQHHSFLRLRLGYDTLFSLLLLPALFIAMVWTWESFITAFWADMFHLWQAKSSLQGTVIWMPIDILGWEAQLPYMDMVASLPSDFALIVAAVVSVLVLLVSLILPERFIPLTYLLRTGVVIQLSAVVYFAFWPEHFPYQVTDYLMGTMSIGLQMLYLIPVILALTYYIFDFSLLKKTMLTLIVLVYFIITIPFQYMLHAWLMQAGSLLLMPLIYSMFGILLDVMMFIALYAWGMSWQSKPAKVRASIDATDSSSFA